MKETKMSFSVTMQQRGTDVQVCIGESSEVT